MSEGRTSSEIAAMFFERFKDSKPFETEGRLVRKLGLTKRQSKWLSDVWYRENRGAVTERRFGGNGNFTLDEKFYSWRLWLYPKGGGVLEVSELLNED